MSGSSRHTPSSPEPTDASGQLKRLISYHESRKRFRVKDILDSYNARLMESGDGDAGPTSDRETVEREKALSPKDLRIANCRMRLLCHHPTFSDPEHPCMPDDPDDVQQVKRAIEAAILHAREINGLNNYAEVAEELGMDLSKLSRRRETPHLWEPDVLQKLCDISRWPVEVVRGETESPESALAEIRYLQSVEDWTADDVATVWEMAGEDEDVSKAVVLMLRSWLRSEYKTHL